MLVSLLVVRPSTPEVTALGSIMEQQSISRIAKCTSAGFRPRQVSVIWVLQGDTPVTDTNYTVENGTKPDTFRLTSYFSRSVTRQDNRKAVYCNVNHEIMQSLVTGNMILDVLCKM